MQHITIIVMDLLGEVTTIYMSLMDVIKIIIHIQTLEILMKPYQDKTPNF
jgi:hypothetical protein